MTLRELKDYMLLVETEQSLGIKNSKDAEYVKQIENIEDEEQIKYLKSINSLEYLEELGKFYDREIVFYKDGKALKLNTFYTPVNLLYSDKVLVIA